MPLALSARSLKCTAVLDSSEIFAARQQIQSAAGRIALRVSVGSRSVSTDVNSKSLRKVLATLVETGADGAVVVLQGKLVGERIEDAGIATTVKQSKPAAAAAEAA